ncbi:MAG: LytTR family DNA-binding domain-containing protein, partial [Paramuribaculum sp.]|nr:LytTR family DNA-binding domain-containing protein [Paramuribaculum sp.]
LRCVVVDDEPLAATLIQSYVEKTPNLQLAGTYNCAQDAVRTIMKGNIDLVFLDIEMRQLNGIEFAYLLPASTKVVFTTAYDNHAVAAFRLNALDYLLKPISYEEFMGAVNKAVEDKMLRIKATEVEGQSDYIMVKSEYKIIQIAVSSILYIEGEKDYVKIYTEDSDKSIMTIMSMRNLEAHLPEKFMRVHRSYIVNTAKIEVIERNRIVFGNKYIPVGDSYKTALNDLITSRLISISRRNDTTE